MKRMVNHVEKAMSAQPHTILRTFKLRGFTLMELLVAMAVIGLVVASLYGAITWAIKSVRLVRENLRATQILLEKMEAIRLYTWEQVNDPKFLPSTFSAAFDPVDKDGTAYSGMISVSPAPLSTTYAGDLRLVNVEVSWQSEGLARRRELSTLVCRTGLQNYLF